MVQTVNNGKGTRAARTPVAISPVAGGTTPTQPNISASIQYSTLTVGSQLVINLSGVPGNSVVTYVWRRNDADIPGAGGVSYTLTSADTGNQINARITIEGADFSTTINLNGPAIPVVLTLGNLSLSTTPQFTEGTAQGTVLAQVLGALPSSILSITGGEARVALSGSNLIIGSTPADADDSPISVTIRETNAQAGNSPKDNVFSVTVTAATDSITDIAADYVDDEQLSELHWATYQFATVTAEPAGPTYTYSLDDDDGGKLKVNPITGQVRVMKTPVAGETYTGTFRATAGATTFTKQISWTVQAYTPSSLVAKWSAHDLATLYQNTAGSTPVTTNGQSVARWVDSVSGWVLEQSTADARPIYVTNAQNGRACLRFDGAGDHLTSPTSALINFMATAKKNYTAVIVAKLRAQGAGRASLISWGGASNSRYYQLHLAQGTWDAEKVAFSLLRGDDATAMASTARGGQKGPGQNASDTIFDMGEAAVDEPCLWSITSNGEWTNYSRNGHRGYEMDCEADGASSMTQFRVGGGILGFDWGALDIYEIRLYDTFEEFSQRRIIEQPIAEDWGIDYKEEPEDLDLSAYALEFEDDFDTFNINPSFATDRYDAQGYIPCMMNGKTVHGSTSARPHEQSNWAADPRPGSAFEDYPTMFCENSRIVIRPRLTPENLLAEAGGEPHLSGSFITKGYKEWTWFYSETEIKMNPCGRGLDGSWLAWWLLDANNLWLPTEFDQHEQLGRRRYQIHFGEHLNPYWPSAAVFSSGAGVPGKYCALHDLTAKPHSLGVLKTPDGWHMYLDRKLIGSMGHGTRGIYDVTINNPGSGIPAGDLTVIVKRTGAKDGRVIFTTSGGSISGIKSIQPVGRNMDGQPTWYRSDGVTPLGYGISLTAILGTETKISPRFHHPMYHLFDFGLTGTANGQANSARIDEYVGEFDAWRVYTPVWPAPTLSGSADTHANAVIAAMTAAGYTPSAGHQAAIQTLVKKLKGWQLRFDTEQINEDVPLHWDATKLSLWDAMDVFYMFYGLAGGEGAAKINWKNTGTNTIIESGSVPWTAKQGFNLPGTAGVFLETSYGLGGAPQFDPWDNHLGLGVYTPPASPNYLPVIGAKSGGNGVYARLGNSVAATSTSNSVYNLYFAPTLSHGIKPVPAQSSVVWTRGYQMIGHMFVNDGIVWSSGYQGSQTTKPARHSGSTLKIGTHDGTTAGAVFTPWWASAGRRLMQDEVKKLNELLNEYKTTVGAL